MTPEERANIAFKFAQQLFTQPVPESTVVVQELQAAITAMYAFEMVLDHFRPAYKISRARDVTSAALLIADTIRTDLGKVDPHVVARLTAATMDQVGHGAEIVLNALMMVQMDATGLRTAAEQQQAFWYEIQHELNYQIALEYALALGH
ncbi:hypothetical protein K8Q93_00020 [Candidatus Parcubacteria bacterium]|nr:hypothetical protein [Candidatus Parcubacteria bacterium]